MSKLLDFIRNKLTKKQPLDTSLAHQEAIAMSNKEEEEEDFDDDDDDYEEEEDFDDDDEEEEEEDFDDDDEDLEDDEFDEDDYDDDDLEDDEMDEGEPFSSKSIDPLLADIAHCLGFPKVTMSIERLHESYNQKSEQGVFIIMGKDSAVAEFSMVPFPGCCGIVILTGVCVESKYQNLGIGTLINKMSQVIALEWGYSLLVCTDVEKNIPQQKILNKTGWTNLKKFNNSRTTNEVCVHAIDLKEKSIDQLLSNR